MNSAIHIHNYDDLLQEEQRLTLLAAWQKDQLKLEIEDFKKQLAPIARIASMVSKVTGPARKNPLLSAGVSVGAGLLVDRALGPVRPVRWLAGVAAPFLLKKAIGLFQRKPK